MVRRREYASQVQKAFDVFLTGLAFVITYYIKRDLLPPPLGGLIHTPNYAVVLLMILIIWHLSFSYFRLHERGGMSRSRSYASYVVELAKIIAINTCVLILLLFALKIRDFSRLMIAMFVPLDWLLLAASAWTISKVREIKRASQEWASRVLIIGTKMAAQDCIRRIEESPEENRKVIGCLSLNPENVGKVVSHGVEVIGTMEDLETILTHQVVDEIIVAIPTDKIPEAEKYLVTAESVGTQIRILPHWHFRQFLAHRPRFYSMYFEEMLEVPTLVFAARSSRHGALFVKRVFDFSLSAVGLLLTVPLLAFIALVIKLSSPRGPILFKQERLGLFGRRFTLYKFRTMVPHAQTMHRELAGLNVADGPAFKIEDDPRVIPFVGRFLRRTGLDELPQLLNVLKGEMSLVGPRPPLAEEVERYELWERRRLSMKPGLTCLWQLQPNRNRIPFKTWMEMDLAYIDSWSLWLDLKIILRTVKAVVAGYGM